jgi:intraflagellar transport protein 46
MAGRDQVADRPYDEAISIDDEDEEDEVSTPASSEQGHSPSSKGSPQQAMRGGAAAGASAAQQKSPRPNAAKPSGRSESGDSSSSDGSSTSSSDGGDNEDKKDKSNLPSGAYNPDDFKGMNVSSEIEELFQYIQRYKPHTIELDAALKPFIPELIPSIGEVDAFLKMPRPDGQPSGLGTTRLDEPTMNPSDPSILDLQLRSLSKNQDL